MLTTTVRLEGKGAHRAIVFGNSSTLWRQISGRLQRRELFLAAWVEVTLSNSARQPYPAAMRTIVLDHCVIHVSDWERSDHFYTTVLGAEIVDTGKGHAYRFGNGQLNLHGPGLTPFPVARVPVPPGGSDLCFEWPGPIEQAVAHLQASAVPVELGPIQRIGARGSGTSVYFRDPDGSLLEFISYSSGT
jgi:catechol 2,3-dioxygenase-like lactoylglutathione lyase family enzyme